MDVLGGGDNILGMRLKNILTLLHINLQAQGDEGGNDTNIEEYFDTQANKLIWDPGREVENVA